MNIIDISWPISHDMTQYKDNKYVEFECKLGSSYYVMEHLLKLHSHTGTHIDAPRHFLEDGQSLDELPLERFIGPCFVADMTSYGLELDGQALENIQVPAGTIVLLKTSNSKKSPTDPFDSNFAYVTASGANYIVDQNWKVVGIDYLGIERNQPDHATHITLAQAGIPIIEGLRLEHVAQGWYTAIILPLTIIGVEAAPARALLLQS